MPSTTTQELIDRARAVSDMRDNFVSPTQWMYWATQERRALDLYIARSGYALPGLTYTDYTVTGSEGGAYPLNPSAGVMAIVCVHEMQNNGFRRVKYLDSVAFMKQPPGSTTGAKSHARFFRAIPSTSDDSITLNMYPEPSAGEVYRITYLPHPKKLVLSTPGTNEATSVVYPMNWEERIVLGMARRALLKEESDTGAVDAEIGLWDRRIEEACWSKVLAENPRIRNGDVEEYGWSDRIIWPPYPNSWFWA